MSRNQVLLKCAAFYAAHEEGLDDTGREKSIGATKFFCTRRAPIKKREGAGLTVFIIRFLGLRNSTCGGLYILSDGRWFFAM